MVVLRMGYRWRSVLPAVLQKNVKEYIWHGYLGNRHGIPSDRHCDQRNTGISLKSGTTNRRRSGESVDG